MFRLHNPGIEKKLTGLSRMESYMEKELSFLRGMTME